MCAKEKLKETKEKLDVCAKEKLEETVRRNWVMCAKEKLRRNWVCSKV